MLRVLSSWGHLERFRDKQVQQFLAYFLVAVVALLVDFCLLEIMVRVFGLFVTWAAVPAFVGGAFVNYWLSIRFVFAERRLKERGMLEFGLFMLIGVLGLAVTQMVLYVGVAILAGNMEVVKVIAAGATFVSNFLIRKLALFS
ncbi:GtrA family protein [Paracidovorax oryzae]|uniref:GtrA family protein n=1 Tax=Paracidovorax oryzae TaxID=862720 RepID=UPI00047AFE5D|nr:GtrA family protein [Paracidovorax oryzae]